SMSAPRFFGRISYSLYLWHWPVLVIPAIVAGGALSPLERVLLVALAVCLATLTRALVEDPLRRGHLVGTRPRRNLALAGAMSVAVVASALGVGTMAAASLRGTGAPEDPARNRTALSSLLNGLESDAPTAAATAAV